MLCLFNYSETTTINVTGKKGGNTTLPCENESGNISSIRLSRQSKNIQVCQKKNCRGRVFRKGKCHIEIKDLRLSDNGTYILRLNYNNSQTVQDLTYRLHIYESNTESKGELNYTDDDKKHKSNTESEAELNYMDDGKKRTVDRLFLSGPMGLWVLVLVVLILTAVKIIKKQRHLQHLDGGS